MRIKIDDDLWTDKYEKALGFHFLLKTVFISYFLFYSGLQAQRLLESAPELRGIDIKENLGGKVPLPLKFLNEKGKLVQLSQVFEQGTPVILTLAYYECPMLCTFVLNGLTKAIKGMEWKAGKEYQLLTVSIDPEETSELALAKRDRYWEAIGEGSKKKEWNFWVGDQDSIKELANSVGFQFYYDERQDEYAHPAVVFVLTPEGVISRYLYGIEYSSNDLKLSLLEASQGKIGNIIDRVILYCYHYDPAGKKYALLAVNVMRVGGILTVILLGLLLVTLWLKELHHRKSPAAV